MSDIYGLSPENVARKRGIVDKLRHQRSRKYSSKFHHNLYPSEWHPASMYRDCELLTWRDSVDFFDSSMMC
eukprot:scaffold17059_cov72-Skeletonema_dohrnii-CCMP3373.AAC.1